MSRLSLRKAHSILRNAYSSYKSGYKRLDKNDLKSIEEKMGDLDDAIQNQDRDKSAKLAKEVRRFGKKKFTKGPIALVGELLIALVIALAVAVVVRQMWFELYQIPTGSMRPTFREKDRLVVTKTSFALNVPMMADHFHFNDANIKRGSIVIWSTENINLPNTDARYFGIIPYKNRYIKRLIAKPGDTLYFYGGKIWAVDRDGNDIPELRDAPWLDRLEHIPFSRLEEEVGQPRTSTYENHLSFKLFGEPIGRIVINIDGDRKTEIFDGKSWQKEIPPYQKTTSNKITTFGDRLGIHNFGMARLLTKDELEKGGSRAAKLSGDGALFLQIAHHHNLIHPAPALKTFYDGTIRAQLTPYQTVIPLTEQHLKKIQDNLYTARFIVKDGRATRYRAEGHRFSNDSPLFAGIPDGTYEFYYGTGYSVSGSGKLTPLSDDHPLYDTSADNIRRLYNMGIDFSNYYQPFNNIHNVYPTRYAYFRDGDLYLMGVPVLTEEDPALQTFVEKEKQRQEETERYIAFKDYGPPIKDGAVDVDFIRSFGITVPDDHYVVLGDNHAMSLDSRFFGFVPEGNLEGTPSVIMWPPGREGIPTQVSMPWITIPRIIVWSIVAIIIIGYWSWDRKRCHSRVFKKLS